MNNAYLNKKIGKEYYDRLNNEMSKIYYEIFTTKIREITNISNNEDKSKLLNQIADDIDNAYSKEKINDKHYNLLKEKISEFENNNNDLKNKKGIL